MISTHSSLLQNIPSVKHLPALIDTLRNREISLEHTCWDFPLMGRPLSDFKKINNDNVLRILNKIEREMN